MYLPGFSLSLLSLLPLLSPPYSLLPTLSSLLSPPPSLSSPFSLPQDIFKHCTDESVTSVTEIPYFEGDFWPNIIEDTIKELDQEAREREASEAATVEVCAVNFCFEPLSKWSKILSVFEQLPKSFRIPKVLLEKCVCVLSGEGDEEGREERNQQEGEQEDERCPQQVREGEWRNDAGRRPVSEDLHHHGQTQRGTYVHNIPA